MLHSFIDKPEPPVPPQPPEVSLTAADPLPAATPRSGPVQWDESVLDQVLRRCFELIQTRALGAQCQEHMRAIPTFGADLFNPTTFLCLSDAGKAVAKQMLGLLAIEHPDVVYAPALPVFVSACLHFMDVSSAYAVCHLTLSQHGKTAAHRRFLPTSKEDLAYELIFFDRLANRFLPQFRHHLTRTLEFQVEQLCFSWFETIFVQTLPFPVWLRLMDFFMFEGFNGFHRFGLAILICLQGELLLLASVSDLLHRLSSFLSALTLPSSAGLFAIAHSLHIPSTALESASLSARDHIHLVRATVPPPNLPPSTHLPSQAISQGDKPPASQDPDCPSALMARIRAPRLHHRPYLAGASKIISPLHLEYLWSWLPNKWTSGRPEPLFSTDVDGYRLTTLLNKCGTSQRTFLFIKTSTGKIFGAFLPSPWQRSSGKYFFGSSDSFVFSFAFDPPRVYPWALGNQDFFISTSDRHLCIGGDSIWLDKDLSSGFTSSSKTFNSDPLDGGLPPKSTFQCVNLEILILNDRLQS